LGPFNLPSPGLFERQGFFTLIKTVLNGIIGQYQILGILANTAKVLATLFVRRNRTDGFFHTILIRIKKIDDRKQTLSPSSQGKKQTGEITFNKGEFAL
jgi:hypothetical protein